jgi:glutathione S-transferase
MWRLYQFTLCPFSRAVRLGLAEKGVVFELVDTYPWERSEALTRVNPAAQTPALENGALVLADSAAILEYFDETVERSPLLGASAAGRAEARRLAAWFRERFYAEVTAPLMRERMWKRVVAKAMPDGAAIREAARAAETHLQYAESLLLENRWLAGPTFGVADIHAAAQLSVADYLAGIDWAGHPQARQWYQALKSRPSFRAILGERMEGIRPPAHYDDPDF